jgi:orotidine-5'-phosphate decarboxylase
MRAVGSAVCLGIDPRPTDHPLTHPDRVSGDPAGVAKGVVALYRSVLEASHERLACVKPQSAFFEALGIPGVIALAQVIADARSLDLPVILDAKRGDIGSTAEAYASAYLGDGVWSADALTVSPYLGPDTLEPYVSTARPRGRGVYTLVATSNPGAATWQDERTDSGRLVHEHVADHLQALAGEHGRYGAIGAVVGATRCERLAALRDRMPDVLLLVPGYGTQGGGAADVSKAFDRDGLGAVVSASRSLMPSADATDFAAAGADARSRVEAMANAIEAAVAARH